MQEQKSEFLGYVPMFTLNGDAEEAALALRGVSSILTTFACSGGGNS